MSNYQRVRPVTGIRYQKLDTALQYRSRTRPWPFIIAHECHEPYTDERGEKRFREREYYAFDDADTYEKHKLQYPHAHEVVFSRRTIGTGTSEVSVQEGRLPFDFDVEERNYKVAGKPSAFVSPSFEADVEYCVALTFSTYYRVDLSRMRYVWLRTDHGDRKFSRHLIVIGTVFCSDWVTQVQTFYALFKLVAHGSGLFSYMPIKRLVDTQIARNNATFRMAWCSKRGGKPLLPARTHWDDGTRLTLYDTLIQLHRPEEARTEQRVVDSDLLIDRVYQLTTRMAEYDEEEALIVRNIPQLKKMLEEMNRRDDVTLEHTQEIVDYLEVLGECYKVRSVEPGRIILDRTAEGECPISGKEHAKEGGYVKVYESGEARFFCFRECVDMSGCRSVCVRRSGAEEMGHEDALRLAMAEVPGGEGTGTAGDAEEAPGTQPDEISAVVRIPLDDAEEEDSSSSSDEEDGGTSSEEEEGATDEEGKVGVVVNVVEPAPPVEQTLVIVLSGEEPPERPPYRKRVAEPIRSKKQLSDRARNLRNMDLQLKQAKEQMPADIVL
jgi:hypothetical protein